MNDNTDNVVDFAPPGLNDAIEEPVKQAAPGRELTRGERLVGFTFNPSGKFDVQVAKGRGARAIDMLGSLPISVVNGVIDMEHHGIIEEAIRRQVDATMWAVKALTWGK